MKQKKYNEALTESSVKLLYVVIGEWKADTCVTLPSTNIRHVSIIGSAFICKLGTPGSLPDKSHSLQNISNFSVGCQLSLEHASLLDQDSDCYMVYISTTWAPYIHNSSLKIKQVYRGHPLTLPWCPPNQPTASSGWDEPHPSMNCSHHPIRMRMALRECPARCRTSVMPSAIYLIPVVVPSCPLGNAPVRAVISMKPRGTSTRAMRRMYPVIVLLSLVQR